MSAVETLPSHGPTRAKPSPRQPRPTSLTTAHCNFYLMPSICSTAPGPINKRIAGRHWGISNQAMMQHAFLVWSRPSLVHGCRRGSCAMQLATAELFGADARYVQYQFLTQCPHAGGCNMGPFLQTSSTCLLRSSPCMPQQGLAMARLHTRQCNSCGYCTPQLSLAFRAWLPASKDCLEEQLI